MSRAAEAAKGIQLSPVDTLFFRDGRSYTVASTLTVAENGSASCARAGELPTWSMTSNRTAAPPRRHRLRLPANAGLSGKIIAKRPRSRTLAAFRPRRCGDSAVFAVTPSHRTAG